MKRTRIAGEKQNVGIGLNSFIMCLAGAFGCFLQNCSSSSPQDCYYLNILKAEQFNGGRICMHCKIFCVLVNTGLILGSVWLKGYTWLNVSISQRTYTKKSSVGREEMTDLFFFFLISFKIQEQTRKRSFESSWTKSQPKTVPLIQHLKSLWSFSLENFFMCSHGEVSWRQFLTSQHGLIHYFFVL